MKVIKRNGTEVAEHFVTVKAEELACFVNKKCVAENLLRRIIVLLIVQTVNTSEVGDSAFCRNSRTAEKYYSFAFVNYALKFFECTHEIASFILLT